MLAQPKDYKSNITKSYAANFLRSMMFGIPIITIFMLSNGLSMTQIMLLEAYFSILVLLLEVPSGALADTLGRKRIVVLGTLILTVAVVAWGLGKDFYGFMLAETIWAIGAALISGADIAIVYDTMKKIGREDSAQKTLSNYQFYMISGGLIASLVSGFLVAIDPTYRLAFFASSVPFFCAAMISLTMKEPDLYKRERFSAKKYFIHIFGSVNSIRKNRHLLLLFANFSFIFAFGRVGFWFFQPYMKSSGIDIVTFGILFALFNVFAAFSAKISPMIGKSFGVRNSVIFLCLIQGASFIGMSILLSPVAAAVLLILLEMVWGASSPLFLAYIHRHIRSEERATIDSFGSVSANVAFAFFSPIFGFISDAYSMQTVFAILGVIIIAQMILFRLEDA